MMALMLVEFYSEVLAMSSSISVIVPQRSMNQAAADTNRKPYPVLYLLHGGSDNHTNWLRNTAIERYVADLGIVVVMPAVHYSFYSDQKHGLNYFTYLSEELPHVVKQFFPVSDQREDTFAAGLSMGGYGAFKLGIRCSDRYAAVASLSGSIDQRSRLTDTAVINNAVMLQMAKHTFGSYDEYVQSDNDLAWLLEQHLEQNVELPMFYHACGTRDHNYEINAAFNAQFKDKINLTYEEVPGRGHDWGFWDEYIQHALNWLPIRNRG